ncbi:MAG: hypothetical protein JNL58_02760 [Planctomyces sp.]|nr:hypothetical protein [Planctomyces sp.]
MPRKSKKQIVVLRERIQKLKKSIALLRQNSDFKSRTEVDALQLQITRAEQELDLTISLFQQSDQKG